MAFNIESFKKNFKDVTDKTVKKTGELTTIAKLNMSIKAEEAKLSDCYKAIGRLFYTAERDNLDNTEEIATYIMQADKIKAVIADCQKELALLRNVVICEGCNNEVSSDFIFCPVCGLKITKPVAEPVEEVCECDDECACECACEDAPAEECTCECECSCEEAPAEECCCEGECTCEEEPKAE